MQVHLGYNELRDCEGNCHRWRQIRKGNIHNEGIIIYETGFQGSCMGRKKASGRVWIRDTRRQYRGMLGYWCP